MPPLYARPRHAAPRDITKLRAALVPAVLIASTGSALGGLAVSASADSAAVSVTPAASGLDLMTAREERARLVADSEARAARTRLEEARKAEELRQAELAAQEAARVAAEQAAQAEAARKAAEAAAPKAVRPGDGRITSPFGPRWGRLHAGVDLACGTGCPVRAAVAGVVLSAGNEGGYGKAVRIQHADGSTALYAHNSAVTVSKGQKVAAGDLIAREGNSGNSTGPHLHFEVRVGGSPVNPVTWLRARGVGNI